MITNIDFNQIWYFDVYIAWRISVKWYTDNHNKNCMSWQIPTALLHTDVVNNLHWQIFLIQPLNNIQIHHNNTLNKSILIYLEMSFRMTMFKMMVEEISTLRCQYSIMAPTGYQVPCLLYTQMTVNTKCSFIYLHI